MRVSRRYGHAYAWIGLVVAGLVVAVPAGGAIRVHRAAPVVSPIVKFTPVLIPVRFAVGAHTLTAVIAGPEASGTVTSSSGAINCPDVSCSSRFATVAGAPVVTLQALPAAGFQFDGWSGSCSGIAASCTVVLDSDASVTASFAVTAPPTGTNVVQVTAPVGAPPGLITSSPTGISCPGVCEAGFAPGTRVTLVSPPDLLPVRQALQWNSVCRAPAVQAHSCTVTADSASQTVAPSIVSRPVLQLAVNGPGTVHVTPTGLDRSLGDWASDHCGDSTDTQSMCAIDYHQGDKVTLKAQAAPGAKFVGWGVPDCGTKLKCVVTIAGYSEITANFGPVAFTVYPSGSGSITIDPGGTVCSALCSVQVPLGSTLTLTATAEDTHQFASWRGCDADPSTPNVCTVTVSSAGQSATPIFDDGQPTEFLLLGGFEIDVFKQGSGVVTATPAGTTACNPNCSNKAKLLNLAGGQKITLTAVDTSTWKFDHWGSTCPKPKPRACTVYAGPQNAVLAAFKRR
jgi:trimeric autotransporter adhesin